MEKMEKFVNHQETKGTEPPHPKTKEELDQLEERFTLEEEKPISKEAQEEMDRILKELQEGPKIPPVKKPDTSPNGVVETVKGVIEEDINKAIDTTKKRVEGVVSENSSHQERIDAGLGIATKTPVLSKLLLKKFPWIGILDTVNETQKDLRDDTKSMTTVLKRFGGNVLDTVTFGLGSKVFEKLEKSKSENQLRDLEEEYKKISEARSAKMLEVENSRGNIDAEKVREVKELADKGRELFFEIEKGRKILRYKYPLLHGKQENYNYVRFISQQNNYKRYNQ